MNDYIVADTTAPLSFFAKHGYYTVGNKIFNHKIYALQEATRTGLPVKWHFHDEFYNQINWRQNPGVPLLELYRMRAQQLRDRYKYIICCWSGGGDSTTMCEAFLENGIPLDEILTLWPITLSQGKYRANNQDSGVENMPSEYDFSIKPRVDLWRQLYPKQRITVADTCEISRNEFMDDTVRIMEKHGYLSIQKWRHMDAILRDRMDQYGNNVCVVFGNSPVEVTLLGDYLAVNFLDVMATNGVKSDYTLSGMPRQVESFYWTTDLPEIVQQQAHDILSALQINPALKKFLPQMVMTPNQSFQPTYIPDGELFRRFRKKIIYPQFPTEWFQVIKQKRTHENPQWESWFHNNPHSEEFLAPWRSAIKSHTNLISEDYKVYHEGQLATYKIFRSKFHVVGRVPPTP